MMDDVLQSLHDLLAVFPIVRTIETERLALALESNSANIPAIRKETDVIKAAAANSEAVTANAVNALRENDEAITEAPNSQVATTLVADQLLVTRNFASAVVGAIIREAPNLAAIVGSGLSRMGTEVAGLGGQSWQAIRSGLPKGLEITATALPLVALVGLAENIFGPVIAMGSLLPAFRPLTNAITKIIQRGTSAVEVGQHEHSSDRRSRPRR
jgi:hypothetical protein